MALTDGGLNLLSESIVNAILQVNATRAAAGKPVLTDAQIRGALVTEFAALLPTT
jgi:hypothetical protein